MNDLPVLKSADLQPTRDYLQDVTKVLGGLQRAFLSKDPHDWHYGLEVSLRGIVTQPFMVNDEEIRALLDLVRRKLRLGDNRWAFKEYSPPELLNNVRIWLADKGAGVTLETPEFVSQAGQYDREQAIAYADALWWMDAQFRQLQAELKGGLTSPILLYPHHFDLALTWFPWDDERQLSIGFSTGDSTIIEPYIYLTAYPEPAGFTDIELPPGARWQSNGFSGAILPYAALPASKNPEALLQKFASPTFSGGRRLMA
jgi:hypothetical protein